MGVFAREHQTRAAAASSGIDWEQCPCPLCGGDNSSPLLEAPDRLAGAQGLWFAVVQCRDCGLCFTNPRPSPQTIRQFYPAGYAPHQAPTSRLRWWRRLATRLWKNDRKVLPLEGAGRLLDFGCGGGSYLARMQRQGWNVTGIDVAPTAVAHMATQPRLRALTGTLPHPQLSSDSFDVITMWQSLEHVHSPLDVLREAHRLLTPHGKLIVAVPNIDSLPFRWFGQAWHGLDLPRHLTHFAPWTLRLMLHRAGFRAGKLRMVRHSSWLRASARLASCHPHGTRWHRWLRGRGPSTLTTWYSYFTRQCDCM